MELNSIGYFQFENLLQGRIPLVLVLLDDIDLKPWYNSMVQMYLENVTIKCSVENALESVRAKKLPPHFAVIILDNDGKRSQKVAQDIEAAGFINTYYVKDGFQGLQAERQP